MQFAVPTSSLVALLLVSARVLAWMTFAPPVATGGIPATVKTVLSVGLALALVPAQRACTRRRRRSSPLAGTLIEQVLVGAALGFLTRLLFSAVEVAGGLLDLFGGFSLSAAYDPLTTTMTSVLGRFYALLCTTLIFATDAHLLIFQGFLRTFDAIPLDATLSLSQLDQRPDLHDARDVRLRAADRRTAARRAVHRRPRAGRPEPHRAAAERLHDELPDQDRPDPAAGRTWA